MNIRTKLFSNFLVQFFAFKLFMAFLHHLYLSKSTQGHNIHSWFQAFHLVKVESNLIEKVCRDTLEDIFDRVAVLVSRSTYLNIFKRWSGMHLPMKSATGLKIRVPSKHCRQNYERYVNINNGMIKTSYLIIMSFI